MSEVIRWLPDIGPDDRALVGGKALELSTLARLGLPVPPSFVVTTQAFAEVVGAEAIQSPDVLRARLASAPFPPHLEQAIFAALAALCESAGAPRRLIARSSATFEDALDFSAAGQLESVVSAAEPDALLDAIRQCWRALTHEPLSSYLRLADKAAAGLAVVVQPLIEIDVGGVLFTGGAGPEGARDAVVIEAGWGFSHGITGELVPPDRTVVDRATRRVLESDPVDGPPLRTVITDEGQARALPAPTLAGQQPLTAARIQQLVEVALMLEVYYGAPQDVEWGFAGDRLVLLQTRPVTAALGREWSVYTTRGGDPDVIWVSGFFEERFPQAITPLTWSYLFPAIEQVALREPLSFVGVRGLDGLPIMRLYNARAYANMAVYQMLYKFFPSALLPADAYRFFPDGDVTRRREAPQPTLPRLAVGVLRTLLTEGRWHPLNYRVWERFLPSYDQELAVVERQLDAEPDPAAVRALLERLRALTIRLLRIHRWSLNYAEVFSTLLRRLIVRWTDLNPERVQTLLLASEASPTLRNDQRLRAMARQAAALGIAPEALPGDDLALAASMSDFLAEFGHRSFCLDLRCPRYADDPAGVWRSVAALMRAGVDHLSSAQPACDEARRTLEGELERALGHGPPQRPYRRWLLRPVLTLARRYVALRETQRFEWQRALHLTRRVFKQVEARWIDAGLLRHADDIFFLQWGEFLTLLEGDTLDAPPAPARVSARRRDFRRIEYAAYPRFLRGDTPCAPEDTRQPGDMLRGIGASAGQAVGTARVIMDPRSLADLLARVQDTDVLVTRATDPGWTPVFGRVRAVVMSLGGQLSHGAIVAREYGIPAVVGLGAAVERIADGAQVLVDGDAGTVSLLAPAVEQHESA